MDAVLIGDLHLDKMSSIFGDAANRLIMGEVVRVIDYAIDHEIPNVIFLGDIAHKSRLSYSGQIALHDALAYACNQQLRVHVILGNHDHDEDSVHSLELLSKYGPALWGNLTIHKGASTPIEVDGVDCLFLSWPECSPVQHTRGYLAFGHFEVRGSTADNGRQIKEGVDFDEDIPLFCGHLHTPHAVGNTHYVGTLYPTSFGESPQKSFTVIRAGYQGRRLKVRSQRVDHEAAIQLRTIVVERTRQLGTLVDTSGAPYRADTLWKYRIVLKEGVEVPDNFLAEHPNIIKVKGYSAPSELDAVLADDWVSGEDEAGGVQLDSQGALVDLLQNEYELPEKAVKKALNMLNSLGG